MPIVCGIHPVLEALNAGSRTIERVVVTKGVRNKRILEVIRRASERGVPLRFEPREALDRTANGERHQGVLAMVAEKGLMSLEELQRSARTPALMMLLDGVEDPRNLGAILRSVEAAGADGVILPDRHTASLSDAASRTAAGALESVKIARIGNVVQALEQLKAKGFWIVGFDGAGKERWDTVDYKRNVVLVLGGEGKGIRRLVKEHCDHVVSLPVFGQVSSLNVSVAAGVALYEAVRQRGAVPSLARPIPPRALVAKKPVVVIGPPPEDREEDPGARRRAAAIAALAAESPAPANGAGPILEAHVREVKQAVEAPVGDEPEADVAEARLEAIEEGDAEPVDRKSASVGSTDDSDDDVADDSDDVDDDDGDREDDFDDEESGDEDDEDDDDDDEEEDGHDTDDDEDDDDGEDEDDLDDEDYDEDDPENRVSPFMPEDNSGSGEVTWGSERKLHAHRPRRDGERRFGRNGRNGRHKDRRGKRPAGAQPVAAKDPSAQKPAGTQAPNPPQREGEGDREGRRSRRRRDRNRRNRPDGARRPEGAPANGATGDPDPSARVVDQPGGDSSPGGGAAAGEGGRAHEGRDPNRRRRRRRGRRRSGDGHAPREGGGEPRPAQAEPAARSGDGAPGPNGAPRREGDEGRRRRRGRRRRGGSRGGNGGGAGGEGGGRGPEGQGGSGPQGSGGDGGGSAE